VKTAETTIQLNVVTITSNDTTIKISPAGLEPTTSGLGTCPMPKIPRRLIKNPVVRQGQPTMKLRECKGIMRNAMNRAMVSNVVHGRTTCDAYMSPGNQYLKTFGARF